MYQTKEPKPFRPNTKKMYEEHHQVVVPDDYDVHHILPVRLGGTHEMSNLTVLHRLDHSEAHMELYRIYGDVKDLCAAHMIAGRTVEAKLAAASKGGLVGHENRRARGDLTGFQLMSEARRKEVAAKAGEVGGTRQRDLGIGIHVDAETRAEWARLGGIATVEQNGFKDSARQAARGAKGGPKNKGFRWCHDGVRQFKYTAAQQKVEPFDEYLARTGLKSGRRK